jgi:hypothetical protein
MNQGLPHEHHYLVYKTWIARHLEGTVFFYLADSTKHVEAWDFDLIKNHVAIVFGRHSHLGPKISKLDPRHNRMVFGASDLHQKSLHAFLFTVDD